MKIQEQKELHEKALMILDMIEKEERYIKASEALLDSRTTELYRGQLEYDQAQVNGKRKAVKKLKESYLIIVK